jgi:hypothetical protein
MRGSLQIRQVCGESIENNYFLGHARPLPAEQVDVSGDEIAGNEMIKVHLDIALQVKVLVSGWSGDVPHVGHASLFTGM